MPNKTSLMYFYTKVILFTLESKTCFHMMSLCVSVNSLQETNTHRETYLNEAVSSSFTCVQMSRAEHS